MWTRQSLLESSRWVANGALLSVCCFLAARTLTGVFAALLAPPPALVSAAGAASASPGSSSPTWSDREVITARNLFDAELVAPGPPPPPPEEELEETELPLGLLGTIASTTHPVQSGWAAIWDAENRERLVVEPGDEVREGAAKVLRIERKRLLLSEDGVVRELVFDEDSNYRPPSHPGRSRSQVRGRSRRSKAGARARRRRRARR
jgi:hypothetical protein